MVWVSDGDGGAGGMLGGPREDWLYPDGEEVFARLGG